MDEKRVRCDEFDLIEGIGFVFPKSRQYFGRALNSGIKNTWKVAIKNVALSKVSGKEFTIPIEMKNSDEEQIGELERLHRGLKSMIAKLTSLLDD